MLQLSRSKLTSIRGPDLEQHRASRSARESDLAPKTLRFRLRSHRQTPLRSIDHLRARHHQPNVTRVQLDLPPTFRDDRVRAIAREDPDRSTVHQAVQHKQDQEHEDRQPKHDQWKQRVTGRANKQDYRYSKHDSKDRGPDFQERRADRRRLSIQSSRLQHRETTSHFIDTQSIPSVLGAMTKPRSPSSPSEPPSNPHSESTSIPRRC